MRVFTVNTKPQFFEDSALRFYYVVFQVGIGLVEHDGGKRPTCIMKKLHLFLLSLSDLLDMVENINHFTNSTWIFFYLGGEKNRCHCVMLKLRLNYFHLNITSYTYLTNDFEKKYL